LVPYTKKTLDIGGSDARWRTVYALSFDNGSSDERVKNSIEEFDARYELMFDSLKGVRYKYNNGTSDRYHTGFIA
jgi:hypothetical protein